MLRKLHALCVVIRTVSGWQCVMMVSIDPLHIVGMQPIWGAKQMKFSLLGIEFYCSAPQIARGLLPYAQKSVALSKIKYSA